MMPKADRAERPAKKRGKKLYSTNIGTGSVYRTLYINQNKQDALTGEKMSESDSILFSPSLKHLILASTDHLELDYISVDISDSPNTETIIEADYE